MKIYLDWTNAKGKQSKLILPITPEEIVITGSRSDTSVDVYGLGELNLLGDRQLRRMTITSFLPHQKYDFAQTKYADPYRIIGHLKNLMELKMTVKVTVTGTDICHSFTIDSLEYGHKEKNADVYYSMSLVEHRSVGSTKIKRSTKNVSSKTVTWGKGDTWHKVTKKVLGSSATWKKQRTVNKEVIRAALKKNPKKRETTALVGYRVVIKK